jgi:hypothetical protein
LRPLADGSSLHAFERSARDRADASARCGTPTC